MASVEELKDALRDTLDRSGCLRKVKATMRAEIYNAMGDATVVPKPELSSENLVINELIREYLAWNGYRDTLSVLLPETGQPQQRPFERSFLAQRLNVPDGPQTSQLPLLYSLVAQQQQGPAGAAPKPKS